MDPFTVEIIRAALVATTQEMKTNLMRTAYHSTVYEALDFTVALTDAQGNLISIGLGLPSFIRGISDTTKALIKHFGSDIHPGDVLMTNDAYIHGSHLPHVITALPIFHDGEIISYACSEPHWGAWGGALGFVAPDIYSLGLQIPPCKVYDRGVLNKLVLSFISLNIRTPELGLGDFRGQIACVKTGEKRILSLSRKYGRETYLRSLDAIANQAEAYSRAQVDKIPDGTYEAEEFLDDDGVDIGKHINVRVKVIVKGDTMTVDLSRMNRQVKGNFNSRAGVTGTQMGFKSILCPNWYPVNDGSFRPLSVILPEGTVVSAMRPAPIGQWMTAPMTICDTMWKALQYAVPEMVAAGHHGTLGGANANMIDPVTGIAGTRRTSLGSVGGGFGAVYNADGQCATICMNDGDTHNGPVESGEAGNPDGMVLRYELRQDSGGAGKFRGGLGAMKEVLYLGESQLNSSTDRSICPPFGALGAKDGLPCAAVTYTPNQKMPPEMLTTVDVLSVPRTAVKYPNPEWPNIKIQRKVFPPGFIFAAMMGGGGGYGSPLERDPQMVLSDVRNEYVSLESAERDYGVVIDSARMMVDERRTEALRRRTKVPT